MSLNHLVLADALERSRSKISPMCTISIICLVILGIVNIVVLNIAEDMRHPLMILPVAFCLGITYWLSKNIFLVVINDRSRLLNGIRLITSQRPDYLTRHVSCILDEYLESIGGETSIQWQFLSIDTYQGFLSTVSDWDTYYIRLAAALAKTSNAINQPTYSFEGLFLKTLSS